jgi:hypothetical protein
MAQLHFSAKKKACQSLIARVIKVLSLGDHSSMPVLLGTGLFTNKTNSIKYLLTIQSCDGDG